MVSKKFKVGLINGKSIYTYIEVCSSIEDVASKFRNALARVGFHDFVGVTVTDKDWVFGWDHFSRKALIEEVQ